VDKKKMNKVQKRLLVVGLNRISSFKPSMKIAREAHILDLVDIKSNTPKEIELVFKNFKIVAESDQCDDIINCILRSYEYSFSTFPPELRFAVHVEPQTRLSDLPTQETGPCRGFVQTYRPLCDYYAVSPHQDMCWDIDNIYEKANRFVLDLSKFTAEVENPITEKDFLPILHALKYNSYFKALVIKNIKLADPKSMQKICELMEINSTLTSITLSGVQAVGFENLFVSMSKNPKCMITSIDLSNTLLEDKGIQSLASFLNKTQNQFVHLNVCNTGIGSKGAAVLCTALTSNTKMSATLQTFLISDNKLGPESSSSFASFFFIGFGNVLSSLGRPCINSNQS